MSDYLRNYPGLPWRVRSYTLEDELIEQEKESKISLLVVSEYSYSEKIGELDADKLIIINESGYRDDESRESVDKYQAAEVVLQTFLQAYIEIAGEQPGRISTGKKTRFIGVYSPVKRCLQTTFAVTLSQILSEKSRTLYLNFESYCGIAELISGEGDRDLADLIYFLNVDKEKFTLHLQTMIRKMNTLDYVPPMRYGNNLIMVPEEDWLNLLQRISETDMFDYVVMDLTDSLQGLIKILRICNKVYTVIREDCYAKIKMEQYENMLMKYEYGDVIEKTERFVFPKFHYIPITPDRYTRGEIADYVREKMTETGVI